MEVRKILWPTDFSKSAEAALPHVQSLTEKYQTEIIQLTMDNILHVLKNNKNENRA